MAQLERRHYPDTTGTHGPTRTSMFLAVQRLVMEISRNPDAPTLIPAPRSRQSDSLLDGEKTGAVLFFSGLFLALVGMTFTATGWKHYHANTSFHWTQLLGPILMSTGGTFMLTSVCKFRIFSCWSCRQCDEEVLTEQTSGGPAFTLSGINQPSIMLRGATAMLHIPPAYGFITQEALGAGGSVNGVHAALPPYDAVCCVDNAAFRAEEEEDSSARSRETDRRSRAEKTEDEGGLGDDSSSTCSRPPAYEDIYPSSNKRS